MTREFEPIPEQKKERKTNWNKLLDPRWQRLLSVRVFYPSQKSSIYDKPVIIHRPLPSREDQVDPHVWKENIKAHDERPKENPKKTKSRLLEERRRLSKNIFPRFFYGGFLKRSLAYLIDLLLAYSLAELILTLVYFALHHTRVEGAFTVASMAKTALVLAYFIVTTSLTRGQTLGKIIVGVKVVSLREDPPGFLSLFLREGVGRYILLKYPILYLIALFTPKKQHLVDLLMDTAVLDENTLQAFKMKGVYEGNEEFLS